MAKQNSVCKKEVRGDVIVFTFSDGTVKEVDTSKFSDEVQRHARVHGIAQRLGDSYAGSGGDVDWAKEQFEAVSIVLEGGSWSAERGSTGGLWVDAVAAVRGIAREDALEVWRTLSEDQVTALKKNARVKAQYARLKADRDERAAKGKEDAPLPGFDDGE